MKIRTKAFWKFQLAVAFVTAIIMTIFWSVTGFLVAEPGGLFNDFFHIHNRFCHYPIPCLEIMERQIVVFTIVIVYIGNIDYCDSFIRAV